MSSKVLITYASAGAGHQRAAKAVAKVLEGHRGLRVELVDVLDYSSFLFQKTYSAIYLFAITYIPLIWGAAFLVLNNPVIYFLISPFRRLFNRLNSYRFVRFLYHLNPDVIISTHFYSSEVIAYQRRIKKYNGRLISVITDFKVHFFWVVKGIDKFVVAFQSTKRELIRKGIEEERVNVLGIPIDAVFAESQNKDLLLERLKLQKNLFTVLIVSGGSGVGPIEKLADELENLPYPVQLIIVCGHNEFLYNRLSSKKFKVPAKIYGFSRNMHELMNISDIIITKSGGLTSSECLASNLPMIIIAPVPGQETGNCGVLIEKGAALKIKKVREIKGLVRELIDNSQKLNQMKENIKKIAKPDSALDLANLVINLKE